MKPDANPYGSITCVRFTGYNLSRPNPDGTPLSVFVIANIRIIRGTLVIKQFFFAYSVGSYPYMGGNSPHNALQFYK